MANFLCVFEMNYNLVLVSSCKTQTLPVRCFKTKRFSIRLKKRIRVSYCRISSEIRKIFINAAGSFGDLNCKNVRFLTFNRNGIYFLCFGSLSIDCSTKTCILSWKYMFHNFSELLYKTIFRFGHSIGYYGIVEYDVSYEIEKKGKNPLHW